MIVMSVKRFDRGELKAPERKPNGWVRFDGYISRIGIQEYMQSDGTVRREFRPPDEVFNQDALESFSLVPLTNDHPPVGYLDSNNTKQYQVGTVEFPQQDGERTRARMLVTDEKAIRDVMSGKAQISCGYTCDLEETPGEYEGVRYDAVQRNIRGNHVAIVTEGRAGPEVCLRVDTKELVLDIKQSDMYALTQKGKPNMVKLRIDGVEYEVPESAAQAFAKFEKELSEKAEQAKSEADKAAARADAAEAQVTELKAELEAAPAKIREQVASEMNLQATAQKILGESFKADGKNATEIKREVAEFINGVKLDGKSEDYVATAFDIAVERYAKEGEKLSQQEVQPVSKKNTIEQARADHRAWLESLYLRKDK